MKLFVSLLGCLAVFGAVALSPGEALAGCMGAPDGTCDPANEDCACDDCLKACSGECTASNPACTLEDACTCEDCWGDAACTNPNTCKNDGTCDFFTEGCCCADCSALPNCQGFSGDCGTGGSGGSGGATGGAGGSTGGGGAGGSGGETSSGGGGLTAPKSDCGCSVPGSSPDSTLGMCAVAIGAAIAGMRRRRGRA